MKRYSKWEKYGMIIWEVEKVSFGSRLKELRSERGISQKDVALNIGVAITTISQYENDSRFPNEEMLRRLCLYYKITSDYLLGLTDSKHAPLTIKEAKKKMITSEQMEAIGNLLDLLNENEKGKYVWIKKKLYTN